MYVWYFTGLPSSSTMLSARTVSCFPRRLSFLATISQLPGVGIIKAKVDAIKQKSQPIYIKYLQASLGLANCYWCFA